MAKSEGIMLDPNYTGKSMSGLIAEVKAGNVDPEVPVVFIHTGGLPQTFVRALITASTHHEISFNQNVAVLLTSEIRWRMLLPLPW